jgi:hypothetical protein
MKSNVLRATLGTFALVCVLAFFISDPEGDAVSKEASKGDFVTQLAEGTSTESLTLADLYPEDKTLGQQKQPAAEQLYEQQVKEYNNMQIDYLLQEDAKKDAKPEDKTVGQQKPAADLYEQQVKEYNNMQIDYLLQEDATFGNKKDLAGHLREVVGLPYKGIKKLKKVFKGKSNAIKLSPKQIKASLGEVKDIKRLVTNCMALKVFAQVNADIIIEKSEKVLGVIKPILTALTPGGNCLEQYAKVISKLMKDKSNMLKGKRMDSVKTHMLRMITKNMKKKGGILVWEARTHGHDVAGKGATHNKGAYKNELRNGLFIFLSPKKLGLTGKPHYLQALACSTMDARVRAEALGAAGVIEKINVATGFKPFWTTAETAKATKVLWEGLCHGAQSLMCHKYHAMRSKCVAVGCQWRAKWRGNEAADSATIDVQTGLKSKAVKASADQKRR